MQLLIDIVDVRTSSFNSFWQKHYCIIGSVGSNPWGLIKLLLKSFLNVAEGSSYSANIVLFERALSGLDPFFSIRIESLGTVHFIC
jgi:hypothetical protein